MAGTPNSSWRAVLGYSVLRLLFFAVPFTIVFALSGNVVLSAVVAAAIGLALSVVLLGSRRSAVSTVIAGTVERRRPQTDEAVEDRAGGDQTDSAAASPKP